MMGKKTGSALWTLNRIYATGSLLLLLTLTACATAPGASPQASTGLPSPTVYCNHILISGDLATNVADLNQPPRCNSFFKDGTVAGAILTAGGWVGEALPAPDNQFSRALTLLVSFYDIPLTFGLMPPIDPDKALLANSYPVMPHLEAELSSSTTRIEQVAITTDQAAHMWVCVTAYKAVILDRMLDIQACRQIDTTASPDAITALARSIVKNDLTQIDAKE